MTIKVKKYIDLNQKAQPQAISTIHTVRVMKPQTATVAEAKVPAPLPRRITFLESVEKRLRSQQDARTAFNQLFVAA